MEIIGRNAVNIVLMSSYDGPVAIIDIISTSEMRIIFTLCCKNCNTLPCIISTVPLY